MPRPAYLQWPCLLRGMERTVSFASCWSQGEVHFHAQHTSWLNVETTCFWQKYGGRKGVNGSILHTIRPLDIVWHLSQRASLIIDISIIYLSTYLHIYLSFILGGDVYRPYATPIPLFICAIDSQSWNCSTPTNIRVSWLLKMRRIVPQFHRDFNPVISDEFGRNTACGLW